MADVLLAHFKRGTPGSPGDSVDWLRKYMCPNMSFCSYQIVDEAECDKWFADSKALKMQKKAYLTLKFPTSTEPFFIQQSGPVLKNDRWADPSLRDDIICGHKLYLRPSVLSQLNITSEDYLSGSSKTPFDGSQLNLQDTLLFGRDGMIPDVDVQVDDRAAINSGSYTVGVAKDYALWSNFCGDVGGLAGDLTGTQETDVSETGACHINVSLGGHNLLLTVDSSNWHEGDMTAGYYVSTNYNADSLFATSTYGGGTYTIEKIRLEWNANTTHWAFLIGGQVSAKTVYCREFMTDGNGYSCRSFGLNDAFNRDTCYFYDLIAWDDGLAANASYVMNGCSSATSENIVLYGSGAAGGNPWYYGSRTYTNYNMCAYDYDAYTLAIKGTIDTIFCDGAPTGADNPNTPQAFASINPADGSTFLEPTSTYSSSRSPAIGSNTTDIAGNTWGTDYFAGAKWASLVPPKPSTLPTTGAASPGTYGNSRVVNVSIATGDYSSTAWNTMEWPVAVVDTPQYSSFTTLSTARVTMYAEVSNDLSTWRPVYGEVIGSGIQSYESLHWGAQNVAMPPLYQFGEWARLTITTAATTTGTIAVHLINPRKDGYYSDR